MDRIKEVLTEKGIVFEEVKKNKRSEIIKVTTKYYYSDKSHYTVDTVIEKRNRKNNPYLINNDTEVISCEDLGDCLDALFNYWGLTNEVDVDEYTEEATFGYLLKEGN